MHNLCFRIRSLYLGSLKKKRKSSIETWNKFISNMHNHMIVYVMRKPPKVFRDNVGEVTHFRSFFELSGYKLISCQIDVEVMYGTLTRT